MPPVEPPSRVYDVAIVGGGAGGTLVAVQLLRQARSAVRIALVDRASAFARGIAFSTQDPAHLLNVRAERMSALPDDAEHFTRWLARIERGSGREAFAPRRRYGRYLEATLEEARRGGRRVGSRVDLVEGDVNAVEPLPRTLSVSLVGAGRIQAPAVVLALGMPPPALPHVPDGGVLHGPLYAAGPWSRDALAGLPVEAPVLLLGSGLTMVDVALSLRTANHRGPIQALSRHGLLPLPHGTVHPPDVEVDLAGVGGRIAPIVRRVRELAAGAGALAEGADWRAVIDAVRPHVQRLWRELPDAERLRFMRHARPYWEVHRHRMAPEVAAALEAMRAAGQLRVDAGRLLSLAPSGALAEARWRRRGGGEEAGRYARVVNCTGPALAHEPLATPLVAGLLHARLARPGPLGIGLDTEGVGALRDAAGNPSDRLFAIGPMRRAELWETTTVKEIGEQAAALAAHLIGLM
jgi:uncharacterized NAD(P)/FAD-binding protein YdhS